MFVLDASVAACWLLDDEEDADAGSALDRLRQEDALVPQLWHVEMRNCLLVAHRRQRLSDNDLDERLGALADLPVRTDADVDLDTSFALARKHGLSLYDAMYLNLAQRRGIPLATLDKALRRAATAEGVIVVQRHA